MYKVLGIGTISIMVNFTQIIELCKGKIIILWVKIRIPVNTLKIFCSKFGIHMENSSFKLNFRQIHLVYLPKPGGISKPALFTILSVLLGTHLLLQAPFWPSTKKLKGG